MLFNNNNSLTLGISTATESTASTDTTTHVDRKSMKSETGGEAALLRAADRLGSKTISDTNMKATAEVSSEASAKTTAQATTDSTTQTATQTAAESQLSQLLNAGAGLGLAIPGLLGVGLGVNANVLPGLGNNVYGPAGYGYGYGNPCGCDCEVTPECDCCKKDLDTIVNTTYVTLAPQPPIVAVAPAYEASYYETGYATGNYAGIPSLYPFGIAKQAVHKRHLRRAKA